MSEAAAVGAGAEVEVRGLTIDQVIVLFWRSTEVSKRHLITRAGEILLNRGGKDRIAELFLSSFLPADWQDEKSPMARAVAGLNNVRAKAYQAGKIKEDCFVFLSVFRQRMQQETQLALDELAANPPYPQFMGNVREKMEKIKKEIA